MVIYILVVCKLDLEAVILPVIRVEEAIKYSAIVLSLTMAT